MSRKVHEALQAKRAAEHAVEQALQQDYPPGARIQWQHSGPIQTGVVVHKCYGDRLRVRNLRTGKARFIYAYTICEGRS